MPRTTPRPLGSDIEDSGGTPATDRLAEDFKRRYAAAVTPFMRSDDSPEQRAALIEALTNLFRGCPPLGADLTDRGEPGVSIHDGALTIHIGPHPDYGALMDDIYSALGLVNPLTASLAMLGRASGL